MTGEQESEIIDRITENPFLTAVGFAREYGVSAPVISSLFRRHGIKCRIAATKLDLTPEQRINRIAFCEVMLEQWDENGLESIVFSDEKTFSTVPFWKKRCYRQDNTRYDPKNLAKKDFSGRITHNYWGAIGIDGPVTPLVRIGRLTAPSYMRVLRSYAIPMMNRFQDNGDPRTFMQDNAPQHTAADTMALLSRQRFDLLIWPPRSPDLNPIENVWSRMVYGWSEIHPRDDQGLHDEIVARWRSVGQRRRNIFEMQNFLNNTIECVILIVCRNVPKFIQIASKSIPNMH